MNSHTIACSFIKTTSAMSEVIQGAIIIDWEYLTGPMTAQKKRLVISGISSAQWEITAISDANWTGLSLWGTSQIGYTAKKDTTAQNIWNYLQYATTWSCGDVFIDRGGRLEGVEIAGEKHNNAYGEKEIDILTIPWTCMTTSA